jgi:dCTP diphosphatase
MADETTTLATLKDAVRRFAEARAWQPFHTPKNLAMALACEAAELLEHFLWVEGEASREVAQDPARREAVADELADCLILLLNLSLQTGIDLADAASAKLMKNERKYPAEKYRGRWKTD